MTNLRGRTPEKQLKQAFHKLKAFNIGRHRKQDHLTHSDGLAKVRDKLFRDIKRFIEKEGITGKVNLALTPENMDKLLEDKLKNLENNSKESYVRSFSSLVQGLKEVNITVPVKKEYFDNKMDALRSQKDWKMEIKTGQAIQFPEQVIEKLYEIRFETGVYANTLKQLALRASEGVRLLENPHKYIIERNGSLYVENLKGKGNHIYQAKEIHPSLAAEILSIKKMLSYSTMHRDLKKLGIKAHGFRYLFAKDSLEKELTKGKEYKEALTTVSKDMNHHRGDMTSRYIKRA